MLAGEVQQSLKLRQTHHKKKCYKHDLNSGKSVVQLKNSCSLPKEFIVFSGVRVPLISVQNSDKAT